MGSKSDFGAILDGFLGVFGALKIEKNRAELRLNIDANFERAFEGLREAPGGRFGVDVGVLLVSISGSRPRPAILVKIVVFLHKINDFQGSRGSENCSKLAPQTAWSSNLVPKASWNPLGFDFWSILGAKMAPKKL